MTRPATVLTPLRLEARALRRHTTGLTVVRTGAGPVRAARAASTVPPGRPVVVAGVAGGLTAELAAGTVVVADRVIKEDGTTVARIPSAPLLTAELRRAGLPAVTGTIVSTPRVVRGAEERARLARLGAVAVDTETAYILAARVGSPAAVIRVIVDTPTQELLTLSTVTAGIRALRQLGRCGPALETWTAAVRRRSVLMAGPRSFCAGVERAISTVEKALDRYGRPVYVRRQIVHNRHVVEDLESRGAVFVQEIDEVPEGATVILSAHGVAPHVRAQAESRRLEVIDATCPLVSKVHHELRRFGERGYQVVMIGHEGHDETVGTLGELPGTALVSSHDDIAQLAVADPERVAYITQTTLSPDDVAGLVADLRERFPAIVGPHAADICYATQNRQDAVAAIAGSCDLVIVVGSANSSNAARLVEVAARSGTPGVLVDDETSLQLDWLAGARTVGVTAAASTPARLVGQVVDALRDLGGAEVEERTTRTENVNFPLPAEVR